jgi:hypothetical protein
MGGWYWIGVALGVGVGVGIAFAGLLAQGRRGVGDVLAVLLGIAAGLGIGLAIGEWAEAGAGAGGGLIGSLSAAPVVGGALRGGGTRAGVAVLVLLGALGICAIAFVPVLGYVEAIAVPALAVRLARRGTRRYAGLRILARD